MVISDMVVVLTLGKMTEELSRQWNQADGHRSAFGALAVEVLVAVAEVAAPGVRGVVFIACVCFEGVSSPVPSSLKMTLCVGIEQGGYWACRQLAPNAFGPLLCMPPIHSALRLGVEKDHGKVRSIFACDDALKGAIVDGLAHVRK